MHFFYFSCCAPYYLCGDCPLKEAFPELFRISRDKETSIVGVMHFHDGMLNWDVQFTRLVQDWDLESLTAFMDVVYSRTVNGERQDKLYWRTVKSWGFEVCSYYHPLSLSSNSSFPWKLVWRSKIPPRVAFVLGKILAIDNSWKRVIILIDYCYMCKMSGESVDHLLCHCPIVFELWTMV